MKATVGKLQNQEKDAELRIEELETQVPFWVRLSKRCAREGRGAGRLCARRRPFRGGGRCGVVAVAPRAVRVHDAHTWTREPTGLGRRRRGVWRARRRPCGGGGDRRGRGCVVKVGAVPVDAVAVVYGTGRGLGITASHALATTARDRFGGACTHASFANTAVARRGRAARPGLRRDAPCAPIDGDEVISNVEVSLEQRITSLEGEMERNIVDHASDVEKTLNAKISESVEVAVDSLGNGWKYPFFLLVIIDGVVGYVVYSWYFKFKKSHLL